MKYLTLLSVLAIIALDVAAQSPPNGASSGVNPQLNPFAVNPKVELPALPPPLKPSAIPLPLPPALSNAQPLPQGLRAILIRNNGQGLLGSADPGAFSIPVTHGKQVRIADQNYYAEVSDMEIKLYSAHKGKLIWEGALGGASPINAPVDMSQVKFIPPLSAGVSPGLKSGSSGQSSARMTEAP